MILTYNTDNMLYPNEWNHIVPKGGFNLIYGDMIYENHDLSWIEKYWNMLAPNSVFQVQTDYHTAAEVKLFLDSMEGSVFINEVIYVQEWGGTPKKGFPMKHDNIYIYANGKDFHWDKSKIEVPKKTAGTKFDKKGTGLKTPCSVFYDLGNFSTMSLERIKGNDGKNIRWQKSLSLMMRLITPFVKSNDWILDPFCGTGTTGEVAKELECNFVGIEYDKDVHEIAKNRLYE